MTWVKRGLVTAFLAVLLASCAPAQVKQSATTVRAQEAQEAPFTDPDDVNLALDLKTLGSEHTDSTISYTVETYEPFEDGQADFKWLLDTDGDQKVDRLVLWSGRTASSGARSRTPKNTSSAKPPFTGSGTTPSGFLSRVACCPRRHTSTRSWP